MKISNNIYFALWADAINYERLKNGGEGYWKWFTFIYMTALHGFNILTFYLIIKVVTGFNITKYTNNWFFIFEKESHNGLCWSFFMMYIPCMLIIYFVIFYKRKYKDILKQYPFQNGKLLIIYCLGTFVFMFISMWLNKSYR